jgi:trigger factor
MKKQMPLRLILIIVLAMFTFTGCGTADNAETDNDTPIEFSNSDGIDNNGFWENVTALDYVELCDYEGILIPSDVHEVTEEAVQTEIETILADYAAEEQVADRSVTDSDTVNIDYVGSIDGVEFEGGSTDGAGTDVTIGVTSYIDDFLEQLVGHSPGESFDIEVTFPDDYGNEDLNGKDATFAITINYIVETVLPDLTDVFVLNHLSSDYGWSTVAEMEAGIKSDLQKSATLTYLQEYIVENTNIISLPEELLEYQKKALLSYYQDYAEYYSMEIEEFLSTYVGVATTDELLQENIEDMTEAANFHLIIQAIAEDAGISVSDEDVAAYFETYLGSDDYSEYKEYYGMPYLKLFVLHHAVMDYLEEKAVLE